MKGNCTLELDVDSVALNNAMSKAVSDAVKSLNIEQIVNAEGAWSRYPDISTFYTCFERSPAVCHKGGSAGGRPVGMP